MKIEMIAFTQKGYQLGQRLAERLRQEHGVTVVLGKEGGGVHLWTQKHIATGDALVYIGATGIAVRAIAPYVVSKTSDPAVLVLDEGGHAVIPLLSGHIGGANKLAEEIAKAIGATPIITTATDLRNVFAVDRWAVEQGLTISNPEEIVTISSALLDGKPVGLATPFPVSGSLPAGIVAGEQLPQIVVDIYKGEGKDRLYLIPPVLTLGVGCRKDTSCEQIEALFFQLLEQEKIHLGAFRGVASIDLKQEESGLVAFGERYHLPFVTYTSEELGQLSGAFTSSSFVQQITGVDNVCERSAAAQGQTLLLRKTALDGVTMAIGIDDYTLNLS